MSDRELIFRLDRKPQQNKVYRVNLTSQQENLLPTDNLSAAKCFNYLTKAKQLKKDQLKHCDLYQTQHFRFFSIRSGSDMAASIL